MNERNNTQTRISNILKNEQQMLDTLLNGSKGSGLSKQKVTTTGGEGGGGHLVTDSKKHVRLDFFFF